MQEVSGTILENAHGTQVLVSILCLVSECGLLGQCPRHSMAMDGNSVLAGDNGRPCRGDGLPGREKAFPAEKLE